MIQGKRKISKWRGPRPGRDLIIYLAIIAGALFWVFVVPKTDGQSDLVLVAVWLVLLMTLSVRDCLVLVDVYETEGGIIVEKKKGEEFFVSWPDVVQVRRAKKTMHGRLHIEVKQEGGGVDVYTFMPSGSMFVMPENIANFNAKLEPVEYVSFRFGKQSGGDSPKS